MDPFSGVIGRAMVCLKVWVCPGISEGILKVSEGI
tara:strand:+ start:455 stop:559 length:105 start_codon:yes stop_codon:yes gene_type:complete